MLLNAKRVYSCMTVQTLLLPSLTYTLTIFLFLSHRLITQKTQGFRCSDHLGLQSRWTQLLPETFVLDRRHPILVTLSQSYLN